MAVTTNHRGESHKFILLLLVIAILPLLLFATPPLLDFPNHVARIAILADGGQDPVLALHYQENWQFLTNLAFEIVVLPLTRIMDPLVAGRVFLGLTFAITLSGSWFLNRSAGGKSDWPIIASVFLWNEVVALGFMSFLFSLGVALWMLGFWLRYRGKRLMLRTTLHASSVALLMTFHLFGVAVYAVALGVLELADAIRRVRVGQRVSGDFWGGALQFLPAIIIFFTLSPTSGAIAAIKWGLISAKATAASGMILLYNPELQITVVAIFLVLAAILLKKGWLRFLPGFEYVTACAFLIFLMAPQEFMGSYFVTYRIPVAFVFLVLAGADLTPATRRWAVQWRISVLLVLSVQVAIISWNWRNFQSDYDDLAALLDPVENGSRIYSISVFKDKWRDNLAPPLFHAAQYSVPEKKLFVTGFFADPTQQPIRLTDELAQIVPLLPATWYINRDKLREWMDRANSVGAGPLREDLLLNFDYVLIVQPQAVRLDLPWLEHTKSQGQFGLYKVIK